MTTDGVATAAMDIIREQKELLDTERLLLRAAAQDDSFTRSQIVTWAARLEQEYLALRDWLDHLLRETT